MPLMTMAQALLRYLAAQSTEIDGKTLPLFAGIFAIFGHGNVAGHRPGPGGAGRQAAHLPRP